MRKADSGRQQGSRVFVQWNDLEGNEMKNRWKAAAAAAAIAMLFAGGAAQADGSYGYNSAGTGAVSATASVKVTVTTPKLIVLRVGAAATQTSVDFTLTPSIPATPTVPSANGNSQAVTWDSNAPTFTQNSVAAVAAYLWHNNSGDAQLTCGVTTAFTTGLASTDVLVASGTTGNALAHPGTDTACGSTTNTLARNTVWTGAWTYSLKPSVLTSAVAGADSEVVTYTATTL
jgi:hypothetical protein